MNRLRPIFFSLILSMSFLTVEAIPTNQMSQAQLKAYVYSIKELSFLTSLRQVEYDKLLEVCKAQRWFSCSGVIPHCYTEFGVKRCPSEIISLENFENFIVPLTSLSYRSDIYTKYPLKISMDTYKKSEITLKRLLNKFPPVKKKFNAIRDRDYKARFQIYVHLQKTEETKVIVFKTLAEVLFKK